jgi:hypothetical protein
MPLWSEEKVDNSKALSFGLSSDFVSNNFLVYVVFGINIIFICLMWVFTIFLKKNSFLNKIIGKEKWTMFYGQIINSMVPLILPWSYIMVQAGVRNVQTKISTAIYSIIFFISIAFPIYYMLDLVLEEKKRQMRKKERKKKIQEGTVEN